MSINIIIFQNQKNYIYKKNKKLKVWARGVDYLISLIETKVGVVRIARRPSKDYPRRAEDPGFESQRARHISPANSRKLLEGGAISGSF